MVFRYTAPACLYNNATINKRKISLPPPERLYNPNKCLSYYVYTQDIKHSISETCFESFTVQLYDYLSGVKIKTLNMLSI